VEDVLLELTVAVEVFRPFVQATYALEGAGCCILEVGPWFHYLAAFWRSFEPNLSFPRVRETIETIAAARTARQLHPDQATARHQLEQRVRELVNPVTQQLSFVFNASDVIECEIKQLNVATASTNRQKSERAGEDSNRNPIY
jgi:hypothetical protein